MVLPSNQKRCDFRERLRAWQEEQKNVSRLRFERYSLEDPRKSGNLQDLIIRSGDKDRVSDVSTPEDEDEDDPMKYLTDGDEVQDIEGHSIYYQKGDLVDLPYGSDENI